MKGLLVSVQEIGQELRITLQNTSNKPLSVRDIAVYKEAHTYSPDQKIYGEGYQMLSQYAGTVEKPHTFTNYSDTGHYRFAERAGYHTVYNLLTVQTGDGICDMYVFTSCHRFNGKIQWNDGTLEMVLDLEGASIMPGETLETERICILKGVKTSEAFQTVGELIRANHPFKPLETRPCGWCSWYCFGPGVTVEDVAKNTKYIAKNLPELAYIQIDDGYQEYMGDWLYVSKTFGDLPALLSTVEENGGQPAIWVAPFIAQAESRLFREHPDYFIQDENGQPLCSGNFTFGGWRCGPWYMLDGTNPEAQNYLTHIFAVMRQKMNIRYFKLDANVWGCFSQGVRYRKDATSVEAYREGMAAIFRGAGEDAVILGCNAPMWPSIGSINAMRISGDLGREFHTIRMLHREIALRSWMHNRFWVNDPDVFTLINQGGSTLSENEIRFHACLMFMSGGMMLCGDDMSMYTEDDLQHAKLLLDSPFETPIVDCFDPSVMRLGSYVGLFNPEDEEKTFSIEVTDALAVKEIWSGREIPVENGVVHITLAARDAAVLKPIL